MLSSQGILFVLMQQRICLSACALGVRFGEGDPHVLVASRKQEIWLPSGCYLAAIYGQLTGRFLFFFSRACIIDEVRCVECRFLL